jgi:hypothetical protein
MAKLILNSIPSLIIYISMAVRLLKSTNISEYYINPKNTIQKFSWLDGVGKLEYREYHHRHLMPLYDPMH